MTIDGRAIAQEILEEVRQAVRRFDTPLRMRAVAVSPTAATQSYLRAKARAAETAGIQFEVRELSADVTTQDVIAVAQSPGADAIIVQLPLPNSINTEEVLAAIPPEKDADALSSAAHDSGIPVPPVAAAIEEILTRSGVSVEGRQAVVIGKGRLVGTPVAARLAALGAQVESFDDQNFKPEVLADADIIVSGAGVPHLVKPEMVKEGVVLIDAGTSEAPAEEGSRIVGDIDPACVAKASVYTPVPGGVGPLTVACLMRNAAQLKTARK